MSPLACSLFALAALLATAHGYCSTRVFGHITDNEVPLDTVQFGPQGAPVPFNDGACPGMHVVGAYVVACNNDPNGPAPEIDGGPRPYVRCNGQCPYGGYIKTTMYCG